MTKRKKAKLIQKFKDIRNSFMLLYFIINAGMGLWGSMDERFRDKEKEFKRIEYALPGYRAGRRIERALEPLINWLVGEP
jgi:diacylglycerol kinase family enzyme